MRRPVLYIAGLLMATGASLALAGPASAAPAHHTSVNCHHRHHHGDHWYGSDFDGGYGYSSDYDYNLRYIHADGNHFNGINVLSGVFGGGGLL